MSAACWFMLALGPLAPLLLSGRYDSIDLAPKCRAPQVEGIDNFREAKSLTITLSPDQEQAVRAAIRAGQITSVEELIQRAIAGLSKQDETPATSSAISGSVFEQGLGLFGSPEDAALLDELVFVAYQERHRPSKREPNL
ncbi:MAG TPA: hypothetical protein VKY85_23480 [Candidatus Angelobacter sp.]|nr:hypothetical protein [Candidatus Angelobacter sp.]